MILINNKEEFKQQKGVSRRTSLLNDQTQAQCLVPARIRAPGVEPSSSYRLSLNE